MCGKSKKARGKQRYNLAANIRDECLCENADEDANVRIRRARAVPYFLFDAAALRGHVEFAPFSR